MTQKKFTSDLTCWVITEGMIGTENQCLGVAQALNLTPTIKRVSLNQPWKTLSPWLGLETSLTFKTRIEFPWPDLLIASGRKSIAASRYIKKKSGGKTFTVQIQDPKTDPKQFDLVAVPFHDALRGANVIVTDGAPNMLSRQRLDETHDEFASLFEKMEKPRIAVLIGGNSRTHKMTPTIMKTLVEQLKQLKGSLMVTASRRTGAENLEILHSALNDRDDTFIWDGTGPNPYHGMLSWANHILVTSDSVSMLSDAGTTGKPVHVIRLEGRSNRFDKLYSHLTGLGVMRPLSITESGNLESWDYEPLSDAEKIGEAIKAAMQKRYG